MCNIPVSFIASCILQVSRNSYTMPGHENEMMSFVCFVVLILGGKKDCMRQHFINIKPGWFSERRNSQEWRLTKGCVSTDIQDLPPLSLLDSLSICPTPIFAPRFGICAPLFEDLILRMY